MASFQMMVVLEIPDNKPEFPDSLGFLPKTALEKNGRGHADGQGGIRLRLHRLVRKARVTTTHRSGATRCLPLLPNGPAA
jgi:hypothetical protein